jgi:hypothetical protein
MTYSTGINIVHGIAYVVADTPDAAYKKLRDSLDKRNLGLLNERELDKIELLAEEAIYPACGIALYA